MFVRFASGQETREAIAVYLQDTADLPQGWLIPAIDSFKDDRDRQFVPTLSEIRTRVADAYLAAVKRERGLALHPGSPRRVIPVEATLKRLAREAPGGPAELKLLEAGRDHDDYDPDAIPSAGPSGGTFEGGLAAILDRVECVDDEGEPIPVVELGRRILEEGKHVPADGGMRARWLASLLALKVLGQKPKYFQFTRDDWQKSDDLMSEFRDLKSSDTEWWFTEPDAERASAWAGIQQQEGERR
jgi:hypothetical protein